MVSKKSQKVATDVAVSDEVLATQIEAQKKVVSDESKKTIINKWASGAPLTKKQYDHIKGEIDVTAMKVVPTRKNNFDKVTG